MLDSRLENLLNAEAHKLQSLGKAKLLQKLPRADLFVALE